MANCDSDNRQSTLIKAMRFPLIVMVLFAHSLTIPRPEVLDGGWGCYYYLTELISHGLCKLPVCWFFVFSGYFFFFSLKEGEFSMGWTWGKWKKRFRSLLLPYVIWNLLAVAVIILKSWLFSCVGLGEDPQMEWVREWNVLGWLWGSQPNFPLWYMRDLVIMSLLVPVLYFLLKNAKIGALIVAIIYLLPVYPDIPGDRAICFFTIGAYLGLHKWNLLEISRKFRTISYVLAPVLLVLATVGIDWNCHWWLLRAFYPFGMMALMNIMDKLIDNERVCDGLVKLSATVFFIYAAHEIFILGWTKGLCLRVFGDGVAAMFVSYLLVPIIVAAVCIALYHLFNKLTPKTLAFVCGGRVKK